METRRKVSFHHPAPQWADPRTNPQCSPAHRCLPRPDTYGLNGLSYGHTYLCGSCIFLLMRTGPLPRVLRVAYVDSVFRLPHTALHREHWTSRKQETTTSIWTSPHQEERAAPLAGMFPAILCFAISLSAPPHYGISLHHPLRSGSHIRTGK